MSDHEPDEFRKFNFDRFKPEEWDTARRNLINAVKVAVYEDPEEVSFKQGLEGEIQLSPEQNELKQRQQKLFDWILHDLIDVEDGTPEVVFRNGLAALSEIDQERFIIENLLEGIKNYPTRTQIGLKDLVTRYNNLGITSINLPQGPNNTQPSSTDAQPITIPDGKFLQMRWSKLRRIALALIQLLINTCRAIGSFVGIKPSVGFTAPMFPTVHFTPVTKDVDVTKLFDLLTKGLSLPTPFRR